MCNVYFVHIHKRIRHAQNNLFYTFEYNTQWLQTQMSVLNGTFQPIWKQIIPLFIIIIIIFEWKMLNAV